MNPIHGFWAMAACALLAGGAVATAKVVTESVPYVDGDVQLEGYLAYDDAVEGKRPGVLVVHEWWGLGEHARDTARKLAELGYVAFAADMYGKGKLTTDRTVAAKWAGELRGTPKIRTRAAAGLAVLAANPRADTGRLAAIGFCFGGTTVLELAYSGAKLAGVVSFHGGLVPATEEDQKRLHAKFLILHGADDPGVKPDVIAATQDALRKAKADWQMIYYGGAVHSFTNPAAGNDNSRGAAYNPTAARRSWEHMKLFLAEIFTPAAGGS